MEKYEYIGLVGQGAFGAVSRAINKLTGEVVAIKRMKEDCGSWQECLNLREVKSLRKMNHPNIVKLKELVRESDTLYFVFEFLDCNLLELMGGRERFSEAEIKNLCFQVFQGLAHMHHKGYFHRDLKPENLLVTRGMVIKVADLGLAREIDSQPPYTDYVSTRWYRAPEVLLHSQQYSSKVDMWAMGAIMAELFSFRPLFPGKHGTDQIYKICSLLGSPTMESWPEGIDLARAMNFQFPQFAGVPLSALIPSASQDAIDLISLLCSWDPCKRPTVAEALRHPFFKSCFYVPPHIRGRESSTTANLLAVETRAAQEHLIQGPFPGMKRKINSVIPKGNMIGEGSAKQDAHEKEISARNFGYEPPRGKIPPSLNDPGIASGISDATDPLGSRRMVYCKQPVVQQSRLPLPPFKARAEGILDSVDRIPWPNQRQQFQAGGIYIRKVAAELVIRQSIM